MKEFEKVTLKKLLEEKGYEHYVVSVYRGSLAPVKTRAYIGKYIPERSETIEVALNTQGVTVYKPFYGKYLGDDWEGNSKVTLRKFKYSQSDEIVKFVLELEKGDL